ncbi:S-adenosylmethionine decarboxylase related protein [Ectobacillus antri]|jgi:homospermidine synthase|uniref:S-adenosylmethionine decarboxylase related protein n=1 Tax=Ectobacillus antri TaxID=2486280 RepID=A0ABT6H4U2_9BACI|nr:S-adenosylmethionine decarboxylase related protein [Ectobacillus antri]MDG4657267.1 S-adenosylmethionine decarboxylase related protein [Ectobacillus antri]MDG5754381.1 S-adenosylmethionine decarboxylase related protein [Ectobacillus antri]
MNASYAITILGSGGGVAKSVLSILNRSIIDKQDPLHHILSHTIFYLIDINQKPIDYYAQLFPNLKDNLILLEFDLQDNNKFHKHLETTHTKVVIDVSWADTIEMLACCNALGVYYINTALENTMVDEDSSLYGFPLTERYRRFENRKKDFTNTKAIISSGMNPGVVQWMALKLIQDNPEEKPLACYIVEHDTSFFADKKMIKSETIYTSWSVECFLDEAILSYPMFVKNHLPLYLYEEVYESEYKVKLGKREFYGCLMPHEEVLTLGKSYDMEIGFIYRVNEHTTELIRNNLSDTDKLWDWNQQVIDPSEGEVEGDDLVGVLLVYENHERYMYNSMKSSEIFQTYKTNATYFQVACGIYAGLSSLLLDAIPTGVYYVDELISHTKSQYGKYATYYMSEFVIGQNNHSDGFLHQRMRRL